MSGFEGEKLLLFPKEPIKLQTSLKGSKVNAGVEVYGKPSLPLVRGWVWCRQEISADNLYIIERKQFKD